MALKKPGELFNKKGSDKETSVDVSVDLVGIKEEFDKVKDLRHQIDIVSSNLNNSLTEVVDKNLNYLTNEYTELLNKFNSKIETFKEELSNEVKDLRKSQVSLSTDVTIIETRQKNLKLDQLKEDIISNVQNLLSGNVLDNIKHLEEKVDIINEKHIKILTESYNEPPDVKNSDPLTPLDKNFVNLQDFQEHYRLFLNRIQRQLSTLGGGGAVLISDLDDVDTSTAKVDNKFLKYNAASGKWVGSDTAGGGYTLPTASAGTLGGIKIGSGLSIDGNGVVTASGGGSGITTENVRTNTLTVSGVSTFNEARFANDKRLKFGDDIDLQIYHFSATNNNFISAANNSDLTLSAREVELMNQNHSSYYFKGAETGSIVYHNNSQRIATTDTGVVITGVATATSFVGDGSGLTGIVGSGSGVVVKDSGSTVGTAGTINFGSNLSVSAISAGIVTVTGSAGAASTEHISAQSLTVAGVSTFNEDVQFKGATSNARWDHSTSDLILFDDTRLEFGDNKDFEIWHGGSHTFLKNSGGDLRIRGDKILLKRADGTENYLEANVNNEVKLFFNGSEKFTTTNTGVVVTGICTATSFSGDGSALTGISATADVVSDTSPQLGGDLDVQTREINTSTSNGNIKLTPNGSGVVEVKGAGGNDGTLQLNCSANSHGVKIKSPPHSAGASYTLTLPNTDGSNGQVLKTDGSGGLDWVNQNTGTLGSRQTNSATTGSIAQAASTSLTIPTAGKSFSLLSVTISAPAYVILYVDTTTRSADSSRSEGTDPAPGSGVITEVSTTASGSTTFLMTPAVLGWNNDGTPAAQIYAKVVNKRATSGSNAITVTLKTVALEA